MAIGAATQEALYFQNWIKEVLGITVVPTIITDNQAALTLSKDATDHSRTKHIDARYHFVRDHTLRGNVKVQWIAGTDQIADGLTKPLSTIKQKKFMELVVHEQ